MSFHNRPPDDGDDFDDGLDAFGEPREPALQGDAAYDDDDRFDGFGAHALSADPFEAEPVLADDEQNQPNSYNVRNILLLATGGFVLLLGAFLLSVGGGSDDESRLAVADGAGQVAPDALPPDLMSGPQLRPGEMPPQGDDLSSLLNDPQVANGGAGGYDTYGDAPPAPRSSYQDPGPQQGGGGGASQAQRQREPSYLDERKEAFFATLGLPSRRSVRTREDVPQGSYGPNGYGAPYGTPAAQMAYDDPQAYGDASQGGYGGPTLASATTGGSVRRPPGPPQLAPSGASAGFRQAGTSANLPFTPFTLAQGTLIPVVLETSVDSDNEGLLIARTVEDVYDRTRRHVLIPRGSQIVSTYPSLEGYGDRVEAQASRLNLPDGRSVDFGQANLYDSQGRRGLTGDVNHHSASRYGAGALLTIAGVAAGVTGRRADRSGSILIQGSDGQIRQVPIGDDIRNESVARGTQSAQATLNQSAQRTINRPNTVVLRAGLRGTVVLQEDIDMVRPYYDSGGLVPVGASPFDNRNLRPLGQGRVAAPVVPPSQNGMRNASVRIR